MLHNNVEGLPTSASDELEELRRKYPALKISTACRSFLKDELHEKLSMQQMIDLYPSASLNFTEIQMAHIRPLLKKIVEALSVEPDPTNFGDIPDESKLDFNRLSPDSKYDIRRARPHIDVVDRYIAGMPNPQNASIIQAEMRAKYIELEEFEYDR